jgi:hypothetical protein
VGFKAPSLCVGPEQTYVEEGLLDICRKCVFGRHDDRPWPLAAPPPIVQVQRQPTHTRLPTATATGMPASGTGTVTVTLRTIAADRPKMRTKGSVAAFALTASLEARLGLCRQPDSHPAPSRATVRPRAAQQTPPWPGSSRQGLRKTGDAWPQNDPCAASLRAAATPTICLKDGPCPSALVTGREASFSGGGLHVLLKVAPQHSHWARMSQTPSALRERAG